MVITLCFQLCSAYYTVLQAKNSRRSVSAINPVSMEIQMIPVTNIAGMQSCYCESTPFAVSKMKLDIKEDKGGMPKGTCPADVMLNSEKIKPVALAVIKLHLSEGIRH